MNETHDNLSSVSTQDIAAERVERSSVSQDRPLSNGNSCTAIAHSVGDSTRDERQNEVVLEQQQQEHPFGENVVVGASLGTINEAREMPSCKDLSKATAADLKESLPFERAVDSCEMENDAFDDLFEDIECDSHISGGESTEDDSQTTESALLLEKWLVGNIPVDGGEFTLDECPSQTVGGRDYPFIEGDTEEVAEKSHSEENHISDDDSTHDERCETADKACETPEIDADATEDVPLLPVEAVSVLKEPSSKKDVDFTYGECEPAYENERNFRVVDGDSAQDVSTARKKLQISGLEQSPLNDRGDCIAELHTSHSDNEDSPVSVGDSAEDESAAGVVEQSLQNELFPMSVGACVSEKGTVHSDDEGTPVFDGDYTQEESLAEVLELRPQSEGKHSCDGEDGRLSKAIGTCEAQRDEHLFRCGDDSTPTENKSTEAVTEPVHNECTHVSDDSANEESEARETVHDQLLNGCNGVSPNRNLVLLGETIEQTQDVPFDVLPWRNLEILGTAIEQTQNVPPHGFGLEVHKETKTPSPHLNLELLADFAATHSQQRLVALLSAVEQEGALKEGHHEEKSQQVPWDSSAVDTSESGTDLESESEAESDSSSTSAAPQQKTRRSRRQRRVPAKYSRSDILVDGTTFPPGFQGGDTSELTGESMVPSHRKRSSFALYSVTGIPGTLDSSVLARPRKRRSLPANLPRDRIGRSVKTVSSVRNLPPAQWTEEEDNILRQKHALGLDWEQCALHLPGRNWSGCKSRGRRLGLSASKGAASVPRGGSVSTKVAAPSLWTDEEEAILRQKHALGLDWAQCAQFIPGRTEGGCRNRGIKLGLSTSKEVVPASQGQAMPLKIARSEPKVAAPQQWTDKEEATLIQKHALGLDWAQCSEFLPGRSESGCRNRGIKLGLPTPKKAESASQGGARPGSSAPSKWTEEEDAILREKHALGLDWGQCAEFIPGRNEGGCRNRGNKLGLATPDGVVSESQADRSTFVKSGSSSRGGILPKWTEEEDEILREKQTLGLDWEQVAEYLPGRNERGCKNRWRRIGISTPKVAVSASRRLQTISADGALYSASAPPNRAKEEDHLLRQNHSLGLDWTQCAEFLSGRNESACQSRGGRLGLTKALSAPQSTAVVKAGVKRKANSNGNAIWTEEEDAILREKRALLPPLSWDEIASFLPGRTKGSVSGRATKLRLSSPKAPTSLRSVGGTDWTEEEDSILRAKRALGTLSWPQTAVFLPGRSPGACWNRFACLSRKSKSATNAAPAFGAPSAKRQKTLPRDDEVVHVKTIFGSELEIWTAADDAMLLAKRAQELTWPHIAKSFSNRSSSACANRHQKLAQRDASAPTPGRRRGYPGWYTNSNKESSSEAEWTAEEDATILRKKASNVVWAKVAASLPGRSLGECQQRFHDVLKYQKKKAPKPRVVVRNKTRKRVRDKPRWTAEDIRLVRASYLTSFGKGTW